MNNFGDVYRVAKGNGTVTIGWELYFVFELFTNNYQALC